MKFQMALVFFVGLAMSLAICQELPSSSLEGLEDRILQYQQRLERHQELTKMMAQKFQADLLPSKLMAQHRFVDEAAVVKRLQEIAERIKREEDCAPKETSPNTEKEQQRPEDDGYSKQQKWLIYLSLYCAVNIAIGIDRMKLKCRRHHH